MVQLLLRRLTLVLVLLLSTPAAEAQFTRGVQMNFGKSRVQYNDFLWTFYRFKGFDTYFYLGGQELAIYAGRTAEADIAEIEKLFDYRINGRFQFMIYNRLTDLKQSNIGLEGEEQNTNTGGLTRIVGSKILVYFDGDYRHFREQIRAGVAQVMINQLMYGGSIKDRLQASVLLNLPDWFVSGLVAYVSKGWTAEEDGRMRDAIMSRKYRNFSNLTGTEAQFAGSSLWNYVIETYGTSSVSNLLYMTRINRNIENGFIYVLGVPMKEISKNWLEYYRQSYTEDDKNRVLPPGKPIYTLKKQGRYISQVRVSPDGNQVAYVTNDLGKYKIWLYDVREKKRKKMAKGGYKSVNQTMDLSYPTLAWHPSGRYLSAVKEKKGKLWLDYYTPGKRIKKETNKFFYFDKVLDFSYSSSGSEIVLSAVQKGQSDIFTFSPRTKTYVQHTKDRWDDFSPRYVMNDRYIAFSSTRDEDTLRPTPIRQAAELDRPSSTDIFLFDNISRASQLLRLTNTPGVNETAPLMIDSSHFSYLSDENGIINRYVSTLDSAIAYIDTVIHYRYIVNAGPQSDYKRNVLQHDINSRTTRYAELMRIDSRYSIYLSPSPQADSLSTTPLKKTGLRFKLDRNSGIRSSNTGSSNSGGTIKVIDQTKSSETSDSNKKQDSSAIDINNYVFQSDFPRKKSKKEKPVEVKPKVDSLMADPLLASDFDSGTPTLAGAMTGPDTASYLLPKQRNYELAFAPSYLLTQLDNNLLNETYQTYTGGAVYFYPGLNALFKIGVNDLLDDYRMVGGFRLSGNLNSNEYYISFENLKRRLDKQISFYRQGREEVSRFSLYRIHTHEVKYNVRWPFNDLTSLRGTAAYRHDRLTALSTDLFNLSFPNQYQNWASVRGEFVYDNTITTGLNLYNGVRYKFFAELFKQVDEDNSTLSVFGADFRHYLKVHRQIIWANRFAASTSLGSRKLIYYLGSTDNAFVPTDNFNYNIQVDPSEIYSFQALATNMRGFIQNIRNGNSFALINSELRVPIFQYLINKPIRSDFIRNFQIIGFGDIGTAWTGTSPYSKNNALFRKDYNGNPISITVTKTVEPIVGGYGFGLRSRVLGYFLRADWAWGVDDGEVQERIFYFSLGLDF
jgi:Tol biopolymer transport system component